MAWQILGKIGAKLGLKGGAKAGSKTGAKVASKIGLKGGIVLGAGTMFGLSEVMSGIGFLPGMNMGDSILTVVIIAVVGILAIKILPMLFRRR